MITTKRMAEGAAGKQGYQVKWDPYASTPACLLYDGNRLVARYMAWNELVEALPRYPSIRSKS